MAASLQQQIDAISDAISRGVKRYRGPDGGEVEYHSLDQMLKAKGELVAQQAAETDSLYVPLQYGSPQ